MRSMTASSREYLNRRSGVKQKRPEGRRAGDALHRRGISISAEAVNHNNLGGAG